MIYNNLTELIGHTPLVQINNFDLQEHVKLYAKLESFNPLHSVKDRIALAMIEDAERKGTLKKGMTIIEPTSGNTGIGLAYIAAIKKYRCILVMPESMSVERRKILEILGAQLILTDADKGMQGAIDTAMEIYSKNKDKYFMPQQFKNPSNPQIHEKTTAVEIWNDTNGEIDIFVAGIGTGGTITGVGRKLKKLKPAIEIIGVEPYNSPVISEGRKGQHKIQGIGAGFIPDILDLTIIDKMIKIKDEDAISTTLELAKREGIFAGISSGAAFKAALDVASQKENRGKTIVVILPDTGERYLSILE